jgi:hypothetical protein
MTRVLWFVEVALISAVKNAAAKSERPINRSGFKSREYISEPSFRRYGHGRVGASFARRRSQLGMLVGVREIGIRLALGASVKGLLRMIVIEGLKPTLISVVLSLLMAAALVRVMATLLFGVSHYDPGTFSAVAVIMIAVGVIVTLLPLYRATRVDPLVTLRSE